MFVRELIVDAIVRMNLAKRGRNVPADIMQNAIELFNGIIKDYGNDNIMTAYQGMVDFSVEGDDARIVLGAVNAKRGYSVREYRSLAERPDANQMTIRDIALVDGVFYRVVEGDTNTWEECDGNDVCDYIPDVIVSDMSDVVNLSYRDGDAWVKLPKVNYSDYYTDGRDKCYAVRNIGESKVEFLVKGMDGRQLKTVYTCAMYFDENSRLDVPAKYLPLLTYAMCYELGCSYPAVDTSITAEYKAKKQDMEGKVLAANDNDRLLLRDADFAGCDLNRVDMIIR